MSWHYSRALVEEYSAESCSAGAPFVRSKLIHMQQGSLLRVKTTDAWSLSQFGTTLPRSMGGPGKALLTWFLEASRARTSAQPEKALESPENVAVSGKSLHGSFAKWDPVTLSWKTHQFSLLGGLELFSGTWPRWGTMQDGACWAQTTPEPLTSETGYGSWPTPHGFSPDGKSNGPSGNELGRAVNQSLMPTPTVCGNYNRKGASAKSGDGLATYVSKFPTPRAGSKSGGGKGLDGGTGSREMLTANHGQQAMKDLTGGSLNPAWVEWLMGWPIGWTDCAASGTGKFQRWQRSHGEL